MLFDGIDPNDDHTIIREAVTAVCRRKRELFAGEPMSPWSLAELRPDQNDFTWLLEWARCLKHSVATSWLQSWHNLPQSTDGHIRGDACIGILLLMLASEVGRREATEGHIWPTLCHERFSQPYTQQLLFVQGHPTALHKDALEAAARRFNLRHVFGIEGLMEWFNTVYLQFGFTYRGFYRQLAHWLAIGGNSQTVFRLLNDPVLTSASFCQLWQALREFRRNNIKVERLILILRSSPWVLPEWHDELVKQAVARPILGIGASDIDIDIDGEVGIDPPFLSVPILRWNPPDMPMFACRMCNLADLDLNSDTYILSISGRERARLLRQPDGDYLPVPDQDVAIDCSLSDTIAHLISVEGEIAYSQPLSLWDGGEDLTVFRQPSGERIDDPWKDCMRSTAAYALCISPDLDIEPKPEIWRILPNNRAHFYLLSSGWPQEIELQTVGSTLWRPVLAGADEPREPSWAKQISVYADEARTALKLGDSLFVQIRHPDSVEVCFVRCSGKPIAFERKGFGTTAGPVPISAMISQHCQELTIAVRLGTVPIRIRRTLDNLDFCGVIQYSGEGPLVHLDDSRMNVEQARTSSFRIYLPQYWHGKPVIELKEWTIQEGDNWVDRVRQNARPLPQLAGLGARLTVRFRAYNNAGEDALQIAREVVDHGIVVDASVEESGGGARDLKILLSHSIEPDGSHYILWWNEDASLKKLNRSSMTIEDQGATWRVCLPEKMSEPVAIAIGYSGVRLGAWWRSDWHQELVSLTDEKPMTLAKRIRWFKLPVLSEPAKRILRRFAHEHPAAVLQGWLSNSEPGSVFQWGDTDERWLAAVRAIFEGWSPTGESAQVLVSALAGDEQDAQPPYRLLRSAQRLMRLDPLLMGRVADVWLREKFIPQRNAREGHMMWRYLLEHIADLPRGALERDKSRLLPLKEMLCSQAATTMGVNDGFIQSGLLRPAIDMLRGRLTLPVVITNLAMATAVTPFRQLLAIHIVEAIEPQR